MPSDRCYSFKSERQKACEVSQLMQTNIYIMEWGYKIRSGIRDFVGESIEQAPDTATTRTATENPKIVVKQQGTEHTVQSRQSIQLLKE
jgi:hypothetical protein